MEILNFVVNFFRKLKDWKNSLTTSVVNIWTHLKSWIEKPTINYTLFAICAVDLLATSGDITLTWSSPIFPKLSSNDSSRNPLGKPITSEENSWIGSLINIGAMLGAFPFGHIADKYGRKVSLQCVAVLHFISYVTMAFANNVYYFYFGRLFGGLAVGGGYALRPMYIAEIGEESKKGVCCLTLRVFWSFGNFLPFAIGPLLSIKAFNLGLAAIPVIFVAVFWFIGTETPYFLVRSNKNEEAEKVLMRLRSANKQDVQVELEKIQNSLEKEIPGNPVDIIKKKDIRNVLLISMCLISFQQLGGCNSLSFNSESIMASSESKISSDVASVLIGLSSLGFSTLVPFVIKRYGRKFLTIFTTTCNSFLLCTLGMLFYMKNSTSIDTRSMFWLPILIMFLELIMFKIGMTVMPMTISSESFPKNIKQILTIATSTTCWTTSFFMTQYFNDMTAALNTSGLFWFYAGVNLGCAVYAYVLMPETKGESVEDVDDMLRRRSSFTVNHLPNREDELKNIEKTENETKRNLLKVILKKFVTWITGNNFEVNF